MWAMMFEAAPPNQNLPQSKASCWLAGTVILFQMKTRCIWAGYRIT